MDFEVILTKYFDKVYIEADFVEKTYRTLNRLGFNADNTIACVGVCRDEITLPLVALIRDKWGEAFNFSSLAGMLFLGKTGFSAAKHHAPNEDGRERYVYYTCPHLAVDRKGEIGLCTRIGRTGTSHACGALHGFQRELAEGKLKIGLDFDDVEQSLIRMKLLQRITYGKVPDLLEITKITLGIIQEDLKRIIDFTVDTKHSDYAVFTGIQIHGPDCNYVWPSESYAVVKNKRKAINL